MDKPYREDVIPGNSRRGTEMIIRTEQLSPLSRKLDADYLDKLTALLRQESVDARNEPVESFRKDVERMLQKAQQFGLVTERDAAVFVITAFLLGEGFDREFAAAGRVLSASDLTGGNKAAWLEQWTSLMFEALGKAEG